MSNGTISPSKVKQNFSANGNGTAPKPVATTKDRLVWFSLSEIKPAPENDLIYRPISPDDPDIQKLAESIQKHGLKEPLVVTQDGYILSGHRRYVACRLLGMKRVECRVEPISRFDPSFETMLCEYNRQRVKSLDEIVREQVISINPDDAYQSLISYRKRISAVSGECISIEGVKTRRSISRGKREMLAAVRKIIKEMEEYWPLSDRTIHYEILNDPPLRHIGKPASRYVNNRKCYQDLCDLLTRGRLAGLIPFDAIEDQTRTVVMWDVHREVGGFISKEREKFLQGYWRDLQQSQPNHIEIIGEKLTVQSSIRDVAARYRIPYTLGRGYCSLDPRHRMYKRFKASGKSKLILLIMSDFDPEGEDIAHSFARSMRDDFGITEIFARKVCLTYGQVRQRNLPPNFDAKKESSRYKKFAAKYGDSVYELEALHPSERSRLLTEAIDQILDVSMFNAEVGQERKDAAEIAGLRGAVGPAFTAALGKPKQDKSGFSEGGDL
jgi:ParB/Sulfiredoxin domain